MTESPNILRAAWRVALGIAFLATSAACVIPGGEVVRVTTVEGPRKSLLEEEDRERLERIRKEAGESPV